MNLPLKIITLFLIALFLLLQYRIWIDEDGIKSLNLIKSNLQDTELENQQLNIENQQLRAEILDLREGSEAIEEIARRELGLIGEGEVFFRVIDGQ